MWFKILQLAQFILSLILEAEVGFAGAPGAEKKGNVMKSVSAELRKEGLVGRNGAPQDDAVLESAGGLVDGFVGLLNLTGAFTHAPASSALTDEELAKKLPEGD